MYKILLVEDNRETAEFVRAALELEDMEVETACDGKVGWSMFQENSYDLVLLDLEMPRMNGEELLRAVQRGIAAKPERHYMAETGHSESGRNMNQIGG